MQREIQDRIRKLESVLSGIELERQARFEGMTISTLVLALALAGNASAPAPKPPDESGLKEWVKKHLHALGRALANLAGKAAAALPGIVGSIVSLVHWERLRLCSQRIYGPWSLLWGPCFS